MALRITQVDAFTDTPFRGNPAAVCILAEPGDAHWMQQVAREMNLSETAFVYRKEKNSFQLRWFTPAAEVDLCGHATLASAHVLWEEEYLDLGQQVRFHTHSGLLTVTRQGAWITMDFPATPATPVVQPPLELMQALSVEPNWIGKSRYDYLVEVDSEATLRALRPDFATLGCVPVRGVIVTSRSASPVYDVVSRSFAPRVGVNEDPVTGSAHCTLAPFWSERLGKTELIAYQASPRGGVVRMRMSGERVVLSGQAVTVLRGELWV